MVKPKLPMALESVSRHRDARTNKTRADSLSSLAGISSRVPQLTIDATLTQSFSTTSCPPSIGIESRRD